MKLPVMSPEHSAQLQAFEAKILSNHAKIEAWFRNAVERTPPAVLRFGRYTQCRLQNFVYRYEFVPRRLQ
ncbi:glutamate--cysteine ligase [Neisseria meningitidis]|nr:glutamate--cysteine ligase [Neisseria meningitidis]